MSAPRPGSPATLDWAPTPQAAFLCPNCGATAAQSGVCATDGARLVALDLDEALVGRTLDGRYDVTALIGRGGMGAVYRAVQRPIGRDVALKVVRRARSGEPDAVRRFFREAKAVSMLAHPNTVTLFDFGQTEDGMLYMAMELLDGASLADVVARGPLLPERAVRIAVQVCDALAAAHALGLVHRDLKPENLMIVERHGHEELVKVLDFGIAKALTGEVSALSHANAVIGTPAYMSPESAQGVDVDARSDLYSLGIVLYELLVGRTPYAGREPLATLMAHVVEAVVVPDVVPGPLADVLQTLLAKSPDDRPATIGEARAALLDALQATRRPRITADTANTLPISAASRPAPRRAGSMVTTAGLITAGLITAGLITAGLVTWRFWPVDALPEAPAANAVAAAVPTPVPNTTPRASATPAPAAPIAREVEATETALPRQTPEVTAAQPSTAAQVKVVVHVVSEPSAAMVFDGPTPLGPTPYDVDVTAGERRLTLKRPGYRDAPLVVAPRGDAIPVVRLQKRVSGRGLVPP